MSGQSLEVKLHGFIRDGNFSQARLAFDNNRELLSRTDVFLDGTWLGKAASYGHLPIVECLVELGADPNIQESKDLRRPIVEACSKGQLDVVEYLLGLGAVLDTYASIVNPLFCSIPGYVRDRHPVHGSDTDPQNYFKIAELLLENGIDYNVRYNSKTMKNVDAIAFACMWGRQDIARLIAERKAKGNNNEIQKLLAEAEQIAKDNTDPVAKGETVRPS